MQREKFASRLGFILISAGCAIGLGNVYRFPITAGNYGGAAFVLVYIVFLILLGIPVMTMELAVGRGSGRSVATSFDVLEQKGRKWHWIKVLGISGNYLLMMFYTTISGWMVVYFFKYLAGSMESVLGMPALNNVFSDMVGDTGLMLAADFLVILVCFSVCSLGLQKGVEKVSKTMVLALFVLLGALAAYACTLPNAGEGLRFYLVPSARRIREAGLGTVIASAMGQAFFTLSIGNGSIAIFGSYIGKERRLLGETVTIVALDTLVALMSGLVIFPACFSYAGGVSADAGAVGAEFLFTTLSAIFNDMPGGRVVGTLFYLFMIFAAFSTVIGIFENIMSFWMELTDLSRKKIALINIILMSLLSLPCVFGLNVWSHIRLFGKSIMELEDYVVSNLLLPVGSVLYVAFCTSPGGWGWDNYLAEVNCGKGMRVPGWVRPYMTYALPVIIIAVLIVSAI